MRAKVSTLLLKSKPHRIGDWNQPLCQIVREATQRHPGVERMERDCRGGKQPPLLRMFDGIAEYDPARGNLADPTAHPERVIVAGRLAIADAHLTDHEAEPGRFQLAIAEPRPPQILAPRDIEPHQIAGVIRHAHLVDLGVVHPDEDLAHALRGRLPAHLDPGMFPAVLGETLVVISDAHLGYAPPAVETALLEFLDIVPSLGDALLLNGDLFEFWFAYRSVVPRHAFRTAAALAGLSRRLPILMVGGNHDRWGLEFWNRELGIRYAPHRLEFEAAGRHAIAVHGDGLRSAQPLTRVLARLVASRAASTIYRSLHPELGFPLVHRLSARFGEHGLHGPSVDAAAARQRVWAEQQLAEHPATDLLVLGHTHRAALVEVAPGRHYLNPGAWFDGLRYAIVTRHRVELRQFTPSQPLPPGPADLR